MTASDTSPSLVLNNAIEMPTLELGVFQAPLGQTVDALATAIAKGYRLIDTAATYKNERQVGEKLLSKGRVRAIGVCPHGGPGYSRGHLVTDSEALRHVPNHFAQPVAIGPLFKPLRQSQPLVGRWFPLGELKSRNFHPTG